MIDINFALFLATSVVLIITPGQDMILVMSRSILVKAPIGYFAGSFSKWLRSRPFVQVWINRISGGVLIALGIKLAFEKRT